MDNGDNTSPKLSTLTNKNGQIKFLKFCLDYEEYDIPLTDFIILLPSAVLLFTYSLLERHPQKSDKIEMATKRMR